MHKYIKHYSMANAWYEPEKEIFKLYHLNILFLFIIFFNSFFLFDKWNQTWLMKRKENVLFIKLTDLTLLLFNNF